MKIISPYLLLLILFCTWQNAHAVLEIEITQGIEGALPIAITTFSGDIYSEQDAVENIVRNDLYRSGYFDVLSKASFPQIVSDPSSLNISLWRNVGVESLLLGKITHEGGDQYRIEFQLFDLIRKKRLLGNVIPANPNTNPNPNPN